VGGTPPGPVHFELYNC